MLAIQAALACYIQFLIFQETNVNKIHTSFIKKNNMHLYYIHNNNNKLSLSYSLVSYYQLLTH